MEQSKHHYIDLPNGTIIKLLLENKLKAGTYIAWDGRLLALRSLERYFSSNFYLIKFANDTDFNVIERKDNLILFEDKTLKIMKENNYF